MEQILSFAILFSPQNGELPRACSQLTTEGAGPSPETRSPSGGSKTAIGLAGLPWNYAEAYGPSSSQPPLAPPLFSSLAFPPVNFSYISSHLG